MILLTHSFKWLVASFFILGFFQGAKTAVGWPYALELLPKKSRALHTGIFGALGGSYGIFAAAFFVFVSKDAYKFMLIGYIMQVVTLV